MGHGRPTHSRRSRATHGESAVTPVIGAVLILGITVVGIAGVLLWGAPMIDRIQAQNAQVAILGEFEDLRIASRELSVPDHSRFPAVAVARGDLAIERGSRIMVTANFQSGCDFRVTGWTDVDPTVSLSASGCALAEVPTTCSSDTCMDVTAYLVAGDTLVPSAFSGADQGTDWLWRLSEASCPDGVCAEAWLHSGDRITWSLSASDQQREVYLDSGAIFSESSGTLFLEKEPIIADTVFGNVGSRPYYGFWLRSLDAPSYTSFSGAGSYQVYFSLLGNYLRTDEDVYRIRFDVGGSLSEAWCNALLARNDRLPDGADAGTEPDSSYRSQAADCGDIGGNVRSVCYAMVAATADACSALPACTPPAPSGCPFAFRLLHARIYTSLAS